MRPLPALLLVLALAPLLHALARRGRRARDGRRYRRLAAGQWLRFGLPTVLILGATGRWATLWRLPAEFAPARTLLGLDRFDAADRRALAWSCIGGVVLGGALVLLLTAWRARRGRPEGTLFGDARGLIPSHPRDYPWAAAVAATAGVTEEAYFRLLLPLLATQACGSAAAGFAGATLLFGAAHRYQGWRGVLATTIAGAVMAFAYLLTASLPLLMALHAFGDLVHLVAKPALRRWVEGLRHQRTAPF
ncbi:CPBP family intramembrane glutamic endopeptidase [uncultured Sphingomonas sp.]|uniref:CPBP family intramembrane glutamic endopeptidase n=1 Tax=uncultured Sphingomonas sp. TaxID=158754 RepID=UPI0035C97260